MVRSTSLRSFLSLGIALLAGAACDREPVRPVVDARAVAAPGPSPSAAPSAAPGSAAMPDVTITALSAGRFELSTAASSTQHLRTVATFERQVDGKWQRIDDDLDVGFGAQGTAHRINVALHFDPSRPQMLAAAKRALPDDPELAKLR